MPAVPVTFDRSVRDYAHNLLLLREWRRESAVRDNALTLSVLGLRDSSSEGRVRAALRAHGLRSKPKKIRKPREPVATNLARLGELLHLERVDVDVLQLALAMVDNRQLRDLAIAVGGRFGTTALVRVLAPLLGHGASDLWRAVGTRGRLVRCGLLTRCEFGDLEDRLQPKDGLLELLSTPELTRDRVLQEFLPNVANDPQEWLDHGHLQNEIDIARTLLAGALAKRAEGINILLYGDTGTGKTELAKALARTVGVPLYAARADAEDGPTTADQRISSLLLGLRIVETGEAMVLFDELEDLFDHSIASLVFGRIGSVTAKDSFNRMFDENAAPVIWTTNHVKNVDPAFLRRFSYAIHVRPGGIRQRCRILKHQLGLPLEAPHPRLDAVAESHEVSPAQIAASIRAAQLMSDDPTQHVASLVAASHRLVSGQACARPAGRAQAYVLEAINASVDLATVAGQLSTWKPTDKPGVAMCLYGPPGTGKTEYVRYLAYRLGRHALVKRASDLLDCYVGQTEQRIARAFEQASIDDSILVLDEVDSLLHDRRRAIHSWEVTQVNELLQQLEAYQGIVACTTNRWDDLDPAVMRRFTFKIELRPPTPDQAVALFASVFNLSLTDEDRARAHEAAMNLRPTPGDFAAVQRRLGALGLWKDVAGLLDEVRVEATQRAARSAGFVRPGR